MQNLSEGREMPLMTTCTVVRGHHRTSGRANIANKIKSGAVTSVATPVEAASAVAGSPNYATGRTDVAASFRKGIFPAGLHRTANRTTCHFGRRLKGCNQPAGDGADDRAILIGDEATDGGTGEGADDT